MIGSSIVVLSLLINVSSVASASPTLAPNGAATHMLATSAGMPSIKLPSVKMPHISMPKFHLPRRSAKANAGDPMEVTARRLRSMIGDQEAWYSDHGRYTTNSSVVTRTGTKADSALDNVQVQVLYAGKKGWTAMASHPDAPGKSCVVYVGYRNALPLVPRTRADAVDAAAEGKPVCDK